MMTATDSDVTGYADAAPLYWTAGWRAILPIPRGRKLFPPTGYTGHHAQTPSYPDILQWAETRPDANTCLHLTEGLVGVDIDAYGDKTGAQTIIEAELRWGALPSSVRSTSRPDDPISGIQLFTVPPGTRLASKISFPDLGVGDIEIIQAHHRYAMVWPSIHPEGRQYLWLNVDGNLCDIPQPDQLPALPQAWIEALHEQPAPLLDFGSIDINICLTPGTPSPKVAERMHQAIRDLNNGSRHDTILQHCLALLRYGKDGHPGVHNTLIGLRELFIAAVTKDGSRTVDEARAEFMRFITNKTATKLLAAPTITDWTKFIPNPDPPEPSRNGHKHPARGDEQFWDARESLSNIYTTALARMCSPWAVLAHCAARALTLVRPQIMLPPLIGGPGSLNWFAAITADSGGGKGSAAAASRELIPAQIQHRNLGSGEGIVAAYEPDDNGDPTHEAVMFNADEIDTLTALGTRTGSTTLTILRSGFSGETLGFSYADRAKRRHLQAHTYRMTLVMSVQPGHAGGLIADSAGGTPQRFMWFPGADSRISRDCPWSTGALDLPPVTEWMYPRELTIPTEAKDLIIDERVKSMQGDTAALDGHALFCREKFAFALTVLDNRIEMTSEDWQLSGVAADMSTAVRTWVIDRIEHASQAEADERGRLLGVTHEAAEHEKTLRRDGRMQRILNWILDKLNAAGADGISQRDLTQKIAGRDRPLLGVVLAAAVADKLIVAHPETGKWVRL